MFLCRFKKGSHVMNKCKMLILRLSLFAVNDIVKFSGVLRSIISAAAYSGVFLSACLNS